MMSYAQREGVELRRDPVRLTLATLGSVILFFVIGYGLTLDVEHLTFAVLDRDQTTISHDYELNIFGSSRYFTELPPITDYDDLDRRMRSGELSLAIEIPQGFGRDVLRGRPAHVAAWIDGAMPTRGETIRSYVRETHAGLAAREGARARRDDPGGHVPDRAPLSLQPRREEHRRDGARDDLAAAPA